MAGEVERATRWIIRYSDFEGEWKTLLESDVFPSGGALRPFVYKDFDVAVQMADDWRHEHPGVDKILVEPLKGAPAAEG